MVIKIQIPDKNKILLFAPEEVICFRADGKYTDIYIINPDKPGGFKVLKSSKNLGHFENKVAQLDFQRVNRSIIINLHTLTAIGHDRTLELTLDLKFPIIATGSYSKRLHKRLEIEVV